MCVCYCFSCIALRGKGAKQPEPVQQEPETPEEDIPRAPKKFNPAAFSHWGGAVPGLIPEPEPEPIPEPEPPKTNQMQQKFSKWGRPNKFLQQEEAMKQPQQPPPQQQQQSRGRGKWGPKQPDPEPQPPPQQQGRKVGKWGPQAQQQQNQMQQNNQPQQKRWGPQSQQPNQQDMMYQQQQQQSQHGAKYRGGFRQGNQHAALLPTVRKYFQ